MIEIRTERDEDVAAVRRVNEGAFDRADEAALVDKLRANCADALSLVAETAEGVVGHILFTSATIEAGEVVVTGMGLAPVGVLPLRQRQGIGSELIAHGLALLRAEGCPFVIVLGHPEYYPRFGFTPASEHGIRSQWEGVPNGAFMFLALDSAAMAGVTGVAKYRPEFDETMYPVSPSTDKKECITVSIQQLSVFLENQPGRLTAPCRALADAGINVLSLSLAASEEFGVLRLIVRDWEQAQAVLDEAGFVAKTTEVVAIPVEDRPGGLMAVLEVLEAAGINLEYLYSFTRGTAQEAVLVFRFKDPAGAAAALEAAGVRLLTLEELVEQVSP